jgi:hypothetical protein
VVLRNKQSKEFHDDFSGKRGWYILTRL